MSGDVATTVRSGNVGVEGGAYVCSNGLKIVAYPSGLAPTISTPLSDASLSGLYDTRFDDYTYYSA